MAFGVGKSRSRVSNAYYLRVHYSKLRAPSPSPSPSTLLRRFAMQMSTKLRERGNFPLTCCVWVRYCGRRLGTAANCCDNCTFEARKKLPDLLCRRLCCTNKYQLYAQQQQQLQEQQQEQEHEHVVALSLHFFCCSYNMYTETHAHTHRQTCRHVHRRRYTHRCHVYTCIN